MGKRFAEENFPPEIQEQAERMNTDESKVTAVELPPLPLNDHTGGTEFQTPSKAELRHSSAFPESPRIFSAVLKAYAPYFSSVSRIASSFRSK